MMLICTVEGKVVPKIGLEPSHMLAQLYQMCPILYYRRDAGSHSYKILFSTGCLVSLLEASTNPLDGEEYAEKRGKNSTFKMK